ncbi:MAG: VCBS repeat-containing protein, partial [Bacteroidota bacterium]
QINNSTNQQINKSISPVFIPHPSSLNFVHQENAFSDFNRDRLLFQMLSNEGPKIAKGDVNGDGLEDVYICGAKDQVGGLFLQRGNRQFVRKQQAVFEKDQLSEDTDALFFDADGDGDQDLYVASGGNEFPVSSSALMDRLYLNDGNGNFQKSNQVLPTFQFESTACVEAADFDQDGDQDLFVGIRLRPFLYGVPMNGYLLENDGTGKFKNVTPQLAPELKNLGLLTDALWLDADNDNDLDLIVAGEWMPITLFINNNGQFNKSTNQQINEKNGFWHCLQAADLDQDGDLDFIAGNMGKNTRLKANPDKPLQLYINDFDQNGTAEQILTQYEGDQAYPLVLRNDLIMQLPHLKKKYLQFENYQAQKIEDIFTPKELQNTLTLEINTLETTLFINQGDGTFTSKALPIEAQFSPVYSIATADFDKDGNLDILLGGNFYRSKPELGIYDASYGTFLKGDGKGNFSTIPVRESGFSVKGEIRDIEVLEDLILVGRNDDGVIILNYQD